MCHPLIVTTSGQLPWMCNVKHYHQLCSSVFLARLCYQTINPILLLCRLFVNFRNSWRFPGSSLYSLPKVVQSTKDIEWFPTWERWRTGEAVWGLWAHTAYSSMSICMSCLSLRLKESESSVCSDCMLRWCKLWEEYQVWRSCQSYKLTIERIEMLLNNWWSFSVDSATVEAALNWFI